MSDPKSMPDLEIKAPQGCGFVRRVVLPVQEHLVCIECEVAMVCIGRRKPKASLLLTGAAGDAPAPPVFVHKCPACGKEGDMNIPFPQTRYEDHPLLDLNEHGQVVVLAPSLMAAPEEGEAVQEVGEEE